VALQKIALIGVENAVKSAGYSSRTKDADFTQVAGHLQVKQRQDAPPWKTRCEHAWTQGWESDMDFTE
jgi:hypothetical protein